MNVPEGVTVTGVTASDRLAGGEVSWNLEEETGKLRVVYFDANENTTAQLDPIAAADFLALLGKINRELGTTIILAEHRLEEALPFATRVIVMDEGGIICDDKPENVGL